MNFLGIIDQIVSLGQNNPIIALIVVLVILFLLYRKPKFTLFLLALILILAFIYSTIMDMASSSKSEKKRLIQESEKSSTVDK